ncbi:TetR/AcrR family transcriptional regulator [Chitinophaga sp. 22321]|uniref:TetR/AcrR family transcriptional regulator n=1 Tax=Chitinophaga hostae TaxID=2831022 RepID=A0ABS5J1T4_9BACT|nr:TetR/AcrR family transcriptional regulator [Chitinophaga hostae]MBS0029201.1 TetR/AcrR family transcriptional regulator [Chitinophaga hostae]
MSDTKEKILKTALILFNRDGIDSVTIRHIAKEMGISHGNLQYHFASTDVIILELYNRMAALFDELVAATSDKLNDELTQFREAVTASYQLIHAYRFIFLHFVEICRRVPAISKHYSQNIKKREPQMMYWFEVLREKGIMRKDIPLHIQQLLVQQIFIVSDFWLSSNEITLQLRGKKALEYHEQLFFSLLYPYFTPKGLKHFS